MQNLMNDLLRINDNCLKHGFKMQTNLAEIGGRGVIELIDSLSLLSIGLSNVTIIERLMYEHPATFRTTQSIKDVMKRPDPVISVFTALGTCDIKCTIQWLISTLFKIREFRPLQSLLRTAPPTIESPMSGRTIKPGDVITFVVYTIAEARIQWWKHYNNKVEIVQDHVRVPEYSFTGQAVSYQTKVTDRGHFYIEVNCTGGFQKLSPSINVGIDEPYFHEVKEIYVSPFQVEHTPSPEAGGPAINPVVGISRVALLIGIMKYKSPMQNLKAPETDITDLEGVLLSIGFTVYCFCDLNKIQMMNLLNQFSEICVSENTYLFFYFAGHGSISGKVDNLQFYDGQMTVSEVLTTLRKKKPKVTVGIFDMCRDDGNENANHSDITEACLPVAENLVLVMSTLPNQKSFEKPIGYENTSLIMKPLCENLSQYACKAYINMLLTNFLNACENIEQKPTITVVGMAEIIGTKSSIPRIRHTLTWIKRPEDQKIMKYITIDFKIFHNIINIFIDPISSKNEKSVSFEIPLLNINNDKSMKINLFQYRHLLKDINQLIIHLCVCNESMVTSKYPIKIEIPKEIVPFYDSCSTNNNSNDRRQ